MERSSDRKVQVLSVTTTDLECLETVPLWFSEYLLFLYLYVQLVFGEEDRSNQSVNDLCESLLGRVEFIQSTYQTESNVILLLNVSKREAHNDDTKYFECQGYSYIYNTSFRLNKSTERRFISTQILKDNFPTQRFKPTSLL